MCSSSARNKISYEHSKAEVDRLQNELEEVRLERDYLQSQCSSRPPQPETQPPQLRSFNRANQRAEYPPSFDMPTPMPPLGFPEPSFNSNDEVVPPPYTPCAASSSKGASMNTLPASYTTGPHFPQSPVPTLSTLETSRSGTDILSGVKDRLAPRDPFNPPPPSWGRPVPRPSPATPFTAFQPLIYYSKETAHLSAGFTANSRPFPVPPAIPSHDVTTDDWTRLWEDMDIVTRVTGVQRVFSNAAPMLMHMGFMGFFATRAIEKRMKRGKIEEVLIIVEQWNTLFFAPRRLDVYVAKGAERLSGPFLGVGSSHTALDSTPPLSRSRSSSSFSSSSFLSSSPDSGWGERRGDRRAWKADRRARKQERRASRSEDEQARRVARKAKRDGKRADRQMDKIRFRLVIAPL